MRTPIASIYWFKALILTIICFNLYPKHRRSVRILSMASNALTRESNALQPIHGAQSKISVVNGDLSHIISDANHASHAEKAMTIYQALKTYPKAVMFSIILSTAIVMESYDGLS